MEDVTDRLKDRIKDNNENNNKIDERNKSDNELLYDTLQHINRLNNQIKILEAKVSSVNQIPLSTTQFFNPSLAQDFYNMNGNSLQSNSYFAVRQMLGICNNKTPNVLQSIPGINQTAPGTSQNGTAVGLTHNRAMSGWWLWTMILNRINYFANMFEIECEDKKLKQALYKYLQDVVLSGYAVIVKNGENYLNYCCNNVELDQDGKLKSFEAYNSAFVINNLINHWEDKHFGLTKVTGNNYVWGQWRSNGYNIWYYVMCYLFNSVDLLYIFWNRARLNKTVVLQKKGNDSSASQEALNFIDPYQNVVTVNTVGILDSMEDGQEGKVSIENKYDVIDLGHGEETQYSMTNFQLWTDFWDNEIGLRSSPMNTNTNRSITDEINPLTIKLTKAQQDFKRCFENMCEQIKEQWGIEVTITLIDDMLLQSLDPNVNSKEEGGNESENNKKDGVTNDYQ